MFRTEDIYQDEIDDLFNLLIYTNSILAQNENNNEPNFSGNYKGNGQIINYIQNNNIYNNTMEYKNYTLLIEKIYNSEFYSINIKGIKKENIIAIGNINKIISGNDINSFYMEYSAFFNGNTINGQIIPQKINNGKIKEAVNNFKIFLQGESGNIQNSINSLQNYITTIQVTISDLQGSIPNIETDITNLENCIDNIQLTINNLKNDLSINVQNSIATLENSIVSIQAAIQELKSSNSDKIQKAINNLQYSISLIQTSINTLIGNTATTLSTAITTLYPQPETGEIFLTQLLNLSDILFSGNVNNYNFQQQAIATNSDGQYVTVCGNGGIYISDNYGENFTFTNIPFNEYIDSYNGIYLFAVAMNTTGQYQMVVSSSDGDTAACNIYVSSDYGKSWTATLTNVATNNYGRWFQSCCISGDGSIMFAGGGGGAGLPNYFSTDYGQENTWNMIGGIWNRPGCTVQNSTFVLATNGQYSTSTYMTENVQTFGEILYNDSNNTTNTYRITCDSSGQFIGIITQSGNVSLSADGGISWSIVKISDILNNIVYSSDASILVISSADILYVSQNYGLSWSEFPYQNSKGIFYFTMSGNGQILYLVDQDNNLWTYNLSSLIQ